MPKRAFDVVVAFGLLLLAAPFMFLIACAIKLTSKGPVIFRQERLGQYAKVFVIFKFRTMYTCCVQRPCTGTNDSRITPVGAFLRSTHLDELPQLINIIRGDMSLVGPRPHSMEWFDHTHLPLQAIEKRLSVKPGLTGLAQVTERKGRSEIRHYLRDEEYISHPTFWQDIAILFRTIPQVLYRRSF